MSGGNILIVVDTQECFNKKKGIDKIKVLSNIDKLLNTFNFDVVVATKLKVASGDDAILDNIACNVGVVFERETMNFVTPAFIGVLSSLNYGNIPKKVYVRGLGVEDRMCIGVYNLRECGIEPIILADYCASIESYVRKEVGIKWLEYFLGEKSVVYGDIKRNYDLEVTSFEK